MLFALSAFAAVCSGVLLIVGVRLLLLASPLALENASPDFDPRRYKPMERLLRQEDIRYLAANGVDRRGIGKLRSQRRAIFRKYLRSLRSDFGRMVGVVRLAMVEAHEAKPELAAAVVRARLLFAYAMVRVEVRLALHAVGYSGITISVEPVIAALENMRAQWQAMHPLAVTAA